MHHQSLLIFGIIFLIGIVLVIYKYSHRKDLHDNVEQLKRVITRTFEEAETPVISQNKLIKGLKHYLGVNEKMALKLIGKARHEDLIDVDNIDSKKGKIEYKKTF